MSLANALLKNDLSEIQTLLDGGRDINATIPDAIYGQKTHLEYIVEFGDLNTLEFFIKNGYDLNKNNHEDASQFGCFVRAMQCVAHLMSNEGLKELTRMTVVLMKLTDQKTIDLAKSQIRQASHDHFRDKALEIFKSAEIIIDDSRKEIVKNVRILSQASRTNTGPSFFKDISPELTVKIAALTGNPLAHDEKESENIAYTNLGKPSL